MYIEFFKERKKHGLGKLIHNGNIKYGLWNFGKKEKFFKNEEDFVDNFDENEERYSTYFKWDINKLKKYLYFEGYEDNDNINNNNSESDSSEEYKNTKKKNNKRKNSLYSDNDEDEKNKKNDDLL